MCFCLIRAHVLLRSVEKSISGLTKETNKRRLEQVKLEVKGLKLDTVDVDRIELYASMDVFRPKKADREQREEEDEEEKEFEDLGSSSRRKKAEQYEATMMKTDDAIAKFEAEWFSFMVE